MGRHFKSCSLAILLLSAAVWGQTADAQPATTSPHADVGLGEPAEFVNPIYPDDALKNKLEGSVALVLTIDPKGNVTDVSVMSGEAEFADAAVKAVRRWKYLPQPVDERTQEVATKVSINFRTTTDGNPNVTVTFEEPTTPSQRAIFKMGKDVTPPQALYSPPPESGEQPQALYSSNSVQSDQAGRAVKRTCTLAMVVSPDGVAYNIHVVKAAGLGLDQKAIEAVKNWRFAPATKDGKPVAVAIAVEVTFNLIPTGPH